MISGSELDGQGWVYAVSLPICGGPSDDVCAACGKEVKDHAVTCEGCEGKYQGIIRSGEHGAQQ